VTYTHLDQTFNGFANAPQVASVAKPVAVSRPKIPMSF